MDFLNALSAVAEAEGHHPDVHLTNYRDVRVEVTTHAIGGLSLHDFVLAAKLDAVGRHLLPEVASRKRRRVSESEETTRTGTRCDVTNEYRTNDA